MYKCIEMHNNMWHKSATAQMYKCKKFFVQNHKYQQNHKITKCSKTVQGE